MLSGSGDSGTCLFLCFIQKENGWLDPEVQKHLQWWSLITFRRFMNSKNVFYWLLSVIISASRPRLLLLHLLIRCVAFMSGSLVSVNDRLSLISFILPGSTDLYSFYIYHHNLCVLLLMWNVWPCFTHIVRTLLFLWWNIMLDEFRVMKMRMRCVQCVRTSGVSSCHGE